jgi:hypothetical protein
MNENHSSPITRSQALTRKNFEFDGRTWEVLSVDSKSFSSKTVDDKKLGARRRNSYFNFSDEQIDTTK